MVEQDPVVVESEFDNFIRRFIRDTETGTG